MTEPLSENGEVHTHLMRFGLGVDESRAYWARRRETEQAPSVDHAFEAHWFGRANEARVQRVLSNMRLRYEAYPPALDVLTKWGDMQPAARRVIVHWHLQLADPIYRAFTGQFLVERRQAFDPDLYKNVVIRWIDERHPDRWAASSVKAFAGKLVGAARRAGLVEGKREPHSPVFPRVPDDALSYGLRLLRAVAIEGSLIDNPYLRSVGLWDTFLADRLRALPDVAIQTQGDLIEFSSATPDLQSWWEARAA